MDESSIGQNPELSPEETDELIDGLNPERSGRKVINDESGERRILDQVAKAPPPGFSRWNARLVAPAIVPSWLPLTP